jgi:hypothetical protein
VENGVITMSFSAHRHRVAKKNLNTAVLNMDRLNSCIKALEGTPQEKDAISLRIPLDAAIMDIVVGMTLGGATNIDLIRMVELIQCPSVAVAVIGRVRSRSSYASHYTLEQRQPEIKTLSEFAPVNVDIQRLVASMLTDLKTTPYDLPQSK